MDLRTRREKLQAMATQTVASPEEARIAQAMLEGTPDDTRDITRPRTLSRAQVFAAPDERVNVASTRVWDASLRVHVVVDDDNPLFHGLHDTIWSDPSDWDGVE